MSGDSGRGAIEFEELMKFVLALVIVGILILLVFMLGDKQTDMWGKLMEFFFP